MTDKPLWERIARALAEARFRKHGIPVERIIQRDIEFLRSDAEAILSVLPPPPVADPNRQFEHMPRVFLDYDYDLWAEDVDTGLFGSGDMDGRSEADLLSDGAVELIPAVGLVAQMREAHQPIRIHRYGEPSCMCGHSPYEECLHVRMLAANGFRSPTPEGSQ